MEEWRFQAKSITKYNPLFRDGNGHFKGETWTSICDLTKANSDEIDPEYFIIEDNYAESILLINDYVNSTPFLHIKNLYKHPKEDDLFENDKNLKKLFRSLRNDSKIDTISLREIVKLNLREHINCELFLDKQSNTVIRFGFDFYMYLNSDIELETIFNTIEKT